MHIAKIYISHLGKLRVVSESDLFVPGTPEASQTASYHGFNYTERLTLTYSYFELMDSEVAHHTERHPMQRSTSDVKSTMVCVHDHV